MMNGQLDSRASTLSAAVFFLLSLAIACLFATVQTDLWIALASGRWMVEHGAVTSHDTFTYTVPGREWINQNWLSHLVLYWLYANAGPLPTLIVTWFVAFCIFALVAYRVSYRTSSTTVGLVAAGIAAFVCRGFLDPRPSIFGLLMLGCTWTLLQSLADPAHPKRSWPAIPLAIVLVIWSCTHGSFVFGFQLVFLFLCCALVPHSILNRWDRPSLRQAIAVVAAAIAALVLSILIGPYHVKNFIHPLTVAQSPSWRSINEWQPAWVFDAYPPTYAFWCVLLGAAVAITFERRSRPRDTQSEKHSVALFELLATLVALALALWARRFISLFCVIGAETIAVAIFQLRAGRVGHGTMHAVRRFNFALIAACVALFAGLGWQVRSIRAELSNPPPANLFDWIVGMILTPVDSFEFLQRNGLKLKVFTDWLAGGPLEFFAPDCKVYIDGRAQQVFPLELFETHRNLMTGGLDANAIDRVLDDSQTEAIVLSRGVEQLDPLPQFVVSRLPKWLPILTTGRSSLLLRNPSPALTDLGRMEREGRLWWPDLPLVDVSRANIYLYTEPRDERRAVELLRSALSKDPLLGKAIYPQLTAVWVGTGQRDRAWWFFQTELQKVDDPATPLGESDREELRIVIGRCRTILDKR